jgi:hypothetical protein
MTVLETAEKWLPAGPRLVRVHLAENEVVSTQRVAVAVFAGPHALMPWPEAVRL